MFFQQDWFYVWKVDGAGIPPWTYTEKKEFHNAADQQIWSRWSMRIRFQVSARSKFARLFAGTGVPINFDVRWMLYPTQWTVNAIKVPKGSDVTDHLSNVTFSSRTLNLFAIGLVPYVAGNDAGVSVSRFQTMPHEFGHALGAPDEYRTGSPYLTDTNSIMNIGRSVRSRHLTLILRTLNTMIPDTIFRQ